MENNTVFIVFVIYTIAFLINTFVRIKFYYVMSKDNGEKKGLGETLLSIAAILGGAWLTVKLLEKGVEKEIKYTCPNCTNDIDYKQEKCNVCKAGLKWDF